jgi:hypothetical protein
LQKCRAGIACGKHKSQIRNNYPESLLPVSDNIEYFFE